MAQIGVSGPSGFYDKAGYLKFLNFNSFLFYQSRREEEGGEGRRQKREKEEGEGGAGLEQGLGRLPGLCPRGKDAPCTPR